MWLHADDTHACVSLVMEQRALECQERRFARALECADLRSRPWRYPNAGQRTPDSRLELRCEALFDALNTAPRRERNACPAQIDALGRIGSTAAR